MMRQFFIDFDGTVTDVDTCYTMVKTFARGNWQELNDLWERRELDTEEVARRTFALFEGDREALDAMLDTVRMDPWFAPFAAETAKRGDRLTILSDGYDYLIQSILRREGLATIPFYANSLRVDGRSFSMRSGRPNPDCRLCGTCKKGLLQELRGVADEVVYIGDGASDQGAGVTADVLFAKDSLARYCDREGIAYHPFQSFADILAWYRGKTAGGGGAPAGKDSRQRE
jgi:2,3-diketo-5-methylthio-1-phosphopentane phosphatase